MNTTRILIYGSAGSGKTTMARIVAREFSIPHLSLDDISWASTGVRLPLSESIEALHWPEAGISRMAESREVTVLRATT